MSTEPISHIRQPERGREQLRLLLHRLDLAGQYQRAARARQLGLQQAELTALEHLVVMGGLTPGELGKRLGLTSGGMTALAGRLIDDGAAGYLTTDTDARQLCEAICAVARGRTVLAPEIQAGLAGQIRRREVGDTPLLSDREREALKLIAEGLTAPAIGKRLHLSTGTVKTHLATLYSKLDVSDRAAAVAQAMRRGLLE